MASSSKSTDEVSPVYSYVTKKDDRKSIELLKTTVAQTEDIKGKDSGGIKFEILKGSLTANNKFYVDFGDKQPFNFFKCYPIDSKRSSLVSPSAVDSSNVDDYAHPCVWGIAQVSESHLENVEVGTKFRAMLPIGESVSFQSAWVDKEDDNKLIIDRPTTNPAYNVFVKLSQNEVTDDERYEDLALACFPGILTGFGLNYNLRNQNFYGADVVVVTSASSKVALALALYLRHNNDNEESAKGVKRIIGYTSESNKEFCRRTGLYDEILGYDDALNTIDTSDEDGATKKAVKYVIIDIAGRGNVYNRIIQEPNVEIVKLLAVGNASATPDNESTFASFSFGATIKMVFAMMNILPWFSSWLNPTQELYFIFNDISDLQSKWGLQKLQTTMKEYERIFCKAATIPGKEWFSVRKCDNENSIQAAFHDIVQGTVPPSEAIILDVAKAVAHRK